MYIVKNDAEKLFFRYEENLKEKFSNEYLLELTKYIFKYSNFLKIKPEKFVLFLLDLDKATFFYYYYFIELDEQLKFIKKDERIKNKIKQYYENPINQLIIEDITEIKDINGIKSIGGGCYLVSIDKKSQKHNHEPDFILSLERKEIKCYKLPTNFQLDEITIHKSYLLKKETFIKELKTVKKTNRMRLLYVS